MELFVGGTRLNGFDEFRSSPYRFAVVDSRAAMNLLLAHSSFESFEGNHLFAVKLSTAAP